MATQDFRAIDVCFLRLQHVFPAYWHLLFFITAVVATGGRSYRFTSNTNNMQINIQLGTNRRTVVTVWTFSTTHLPGNRPSTGRSAATCASRWSGWWAGWRPPPGGASSRCWRRSPAGPGRTQQTRCSATSAPSGRKGSYHGLNSRGRRRRKEELQGRNGRSEAQCPLLARYLISPTNKLVAKWETLICKESLAHTEPNQSNMRGRFHWPDSAHHRRSEH